MKAGLDRKYTIEFRDSAVKWVFRTNVTADSGIVTGIPVNVTGVIPAS